MYLVAGAYQIFLYECVCEWVKLYEALWVQAQKHYAETSPITKKQNICFKVKWSLFMVSVTYFTVRPHLINCLQVFADKSTSLMQPVDLQEDFQCKSTYLFATCITYWPVFAKSWVTHWSLGLSDWLLTHCLCLCFITMCDQQFCGCFVSFLIDEFI